MEKVAPTLVSHNHVVCRCAQNRRNVSIFFVTKLCFAMTSSDDIRFLRAMCYDGQRPTVLMNMRKLVNYLYNIHSLYIVFTDIVGWYVIITESFDNFDDQRPFSCVRGQYNVSAEREWVKALTIM
jgi:hypothetical protein